MYNTIPPDEIIKKTVEALKANGIEAIVVPDSQAAKHQLLEMIPSGAQVMTMTSVTLDSIGAASELNDPSKYGTVRPKLSDPTTTPFDKRALGAAAEYVTGSVHGITESGQLVIASNSGSQMAAEVYGSPNVIFVVGAQKIVKDLNEGMKRISEYVLPLESERANKAYNITTGSFVSKLLVITREVNPGRIRVVLVKEVLGY